MKLMGDSFHSQEITESLVAPAKGVWEGVKGITTAKGSQGKALLEDCTGGSSPRSQLFTSPAT